MTERQSSNRDVNRAIRSWLHENQHEDVSRVAGTVLDQLDTIPQRRASWPAWRTPIMNKVLTYGLGAAAVVVLVVLGAQFLSSNGNTGTTPTATATPTPTATATSTPHPTSSTPVAGTLASGSFTAPLGEFGEAFDVEAVQTGDEVSGTMEISNPAGAEGAYSVDVQCARTTDHGVLMIGGEVTESTYGEFIQEGAYVVIALAPGTPVRMLWAVDVLVTDEVPAPAESCSAYVESLLGDPQFGAVDVDGRPIAGDLYLAE